MRETGLPFAKFAGKMSLEHAASFAARPLAPERAREFERLAADSLAEQAAIEAADMLSFEDYLAGYFAQSA